MKKFRSILITILVFLISTILPAQDSKEDPQKLQNQYKYQSKTKEQTKEKNQGEENEQTKYMEQSKVQTKSKLQAKKDNGFVDEDGNGYNDNIPDHDGDGIPNGADPDYDGPKERKGNAKGFVDSDGDGINDNLRDEDGDGIPNGQDEDFVPSGDGTGAKHSYMNRNGEINGKNMHKQGKGSGTGPCSEEGLSTGSGGEKGRNGQQKSGGNK